MLGGTLVTDLEQGMMYMIALLTMIQIISGLIEPVLTLSISCACTKVRIYEESRDNVEKNK